MLTTLEQTAVAPKPATAKRYSSKFEKQLMIENLRSAVEIYGREWLRKAFKAKKLQNTFNQLSHKLSESPLLFSIRSDSLFRSKTDELRRANLCNWRSSFRSITPRPSLPSRYFFQSLLEKIELLGQPKLTDTVLDTLSPPLQYWLITAGRKS